ncbi:MAG: hypothetical protein HWE25_14455 [Alphaproteobacteria bacterium]|nr:hypothetical protein [Alphaproteobacteria bacterium]
MSSIVHIGMHKTASSSLQAMWGAMDDVVLSKAFCLEISNRLISTIESGGQKPFELPTDIPLFATSSNVADPYRVYSAENLSNPNTSRFDRPVLEAFHKTAADVFYKIAGEGAQVLLLVRSPESWLKSRYKQYVHKGGSFRFQRFLNSNSSELAYLLSLDFLKYWEDQFGAKNVHILPYEMLAEDMDLFFDLLHNQLGLPKKEFSADPRENVSVAEDEAAFLRHAARYMRLFTDNASLGAGTAAQFRQNAIIVSDVLRTEIQKNPDGKIARLARRIGKSEGADVTWPQNIVAAIRDGMVPRLQEERDGFHGHIGTYLAAFQ